MVAFDEMHPDESGLRTPYSAYDRWFQAQDPGRLTEKMRDAERRPRGGGARPADVDAHLQRAGVAGLAQARRRRRPRARTSLRRARRSADRHAAGRPAAGHASFELARDVDGRPPGRRIADLFRWPAQPAPRRRGFETDRTSVVVLWITRFVIYVALFVGAGGAFYAAFIAREVSVRALIDCCAPAGSRIDRGNRLGRPARRRRAGRAAFGDQAAAGLGKRGCQFLRVDRSAVVLSLAAAHVSLSSSTAATALAALSLAALGMALAASGHASAASPQWLTRPAVFVHGVSVAFWAGALIPLAGALLNRRTHELARFSRWIPLPFAALSLAAWCWPRSGPAASALWNTAMATFCARSSSWWPWFGAGAANRRATRRALGGDGQAIRAIATATRIEVVCSRSCSRWWRHGVSPRRPARSCSPPFSLSMFISTPAGRWPICKSIPPMPTAGELRSRCLTASSAACRKGGHGCFRQARHAASSRSGSPPRMWRRRSGRSTAAPAGDGTVERKSRNPDQRFRENRGRR